MTSPRLKEERGTEARREASASLGDYGFRIGGYFRSPDFRRR